jgi:hypothetical protein
MPRHMRFRRYTAMVSQHITEQNRLVGDNNDLSPSAHTDPAR